MKYLHAWLALALVALAGYWMLTHAMPWTIKFGLVVGAYFLALNWLRQYSPRTAYWINIFVISIILGLIQGLLSGGRRR